MRQRHEPEQISIDEREIQGSGVVGPLISRPAESTSAGLQPVCGPACGCAIRVAHQKEVGRTTRLVAQNQTGYGNRTMFITAAARSRTPMAMPCAGCLPVPRRVATHAAEKAVRPQQTTPISKTYAGIRATWAR